MTNVPLGRSAYKRLYGGTPEVKLLNRWLEANPANLREGTSVLARPGTTNLMGLNPEGFDVPNVGTMRGNYSLAGLFDDSLFVVCGTALYRINQDMSVTPISGVIAGQGYPEVAWARGAGYQQLWIMDGVTLQYYPGTSSASAFLSMTGTIVNGTDIFQVGNVYYTWGTTFSGSDNGTSSHPYVINPHTSDGAILDPMGQLVLAVMAEGSPGVDYSPTLIAANITVMAAGSTTGVVGVGVNMGGSGFTSAPTVVFTSTLGSGASATATVAGGAVTDVTMVDFGNGYSLTNPPVVSFVGGGGSGATAMATVGSPSPGQVVVFTALTPGTGGNAVPFVVTGGTALVASSATLINGGVDALLGCEIPGGLAPCSLSQVSSYVVVAINDSQQFYWINPGDVTIDALNFASKESSPDNITHVRAVGDQLLVIGEKSTENWYATGNLAAPFAPVEGRVYARGAITGTPVVVDDGIFMVGDDGRVYSIGFQSGDATDAGWGVTRVSNNGIEERIRYQIRREAGLTP